MKKMTMKKKMTKKQAQAIRPELFRIADQFFKNLDDRDLTHDNKIRLITCIGILWRLGHIDSGTYLSMERILDWVTGNSIDKGPYNYPSYYRFDFCNMISQITEAADE